MKLENGRVSAEKQEKDHLIKELTSKNLELLTKVATLETGLKPLHEDLKNQIIDY
jgi:hypothetical protein